MVTRFVNGIVIADIKQPGIKIEWYISRSCWYCSIICTILDIENSYFI